jgi:hypothetical protein
MVQPAAARGEPSKILMLLLCDKRNDEARMTNAELSSNAQMTKA